MKQDKTISREEFKSLLDQGWTFSRAFLYEQQNNPKATFVHVQISPRETMYVRLWSRGTSRFNSK